MGFMTIDGQRVEFTNEPNVLTVIRNAEIDIPTLCYHSELSIYGACRLCTVENDRGKTFASCAEPPRDGMVIYTNTPRLMRYRRTILELLRAITGWSNEEIIDAFGKKEGGSGDGRN